MKKINRKKRIGAFVLALVLALTVFPAIGSTINDEGGVAEVYAADTPTVFVDVSLDSSISTHFNTLITEGEFESIVTMGPSMYGTPYNLTVRVDGRDETPATSAIECRDDRYESMYLSDCRLDSDKNYQIVIPLDIADLYRDYKRGNVDLVVRVNDKVCSDAQWSERNSYIINLTIPLGKPVKKSANGWTKLSTVYVHDYLSGLDDEWVSSWYYYEDGYRVWCDFRRDSKGWCYLDSDGRQTKLKWIKWWRDDNWYFIDQTGYMAANAWIHGSYWYYVKSNGAMAASEWVKYRGQWYYLKADGAMATKQWAKDSKGWMWLNGSGKITKSEWVKYKGDWYYLKSNGYMATGWQKINGKYYYFNSSGIWVEAM